MKISIKHLIPLFLGALVATAGCDSSTQPNEATTAVDAAPANAAGTAPAYDVSRSVTTISPNLYKAMADTMNMRILEAVYQPGDSSIVHAHPDFAMYILEGSMVELTAADGKKQQVDFKKGMAVIMPAATHSAKNIGKSALRIIVVEVNRPRE